ncbi:MAG: hypothetical protein ABI353_11825, partial [Isosphaeraceae bacterium]
LTPSTFKGSEAMQEQVDIGAPEQDLFLPEAAEEMSKYHKEHGEYAKQWYLLNFPFAYYGFHTTDPDVLPKKEFGNRWSPRDCEYTYIIKGADRDHFLIQAVNWAGHVDWEIRDGQTEPKQVGNAASKKGNAQQKLPEQDLFLLVAAHAMHEQHKRRGEYPKQWYLLDDFTFSPTPYQENDPDVRPKQEFGNRWRPRDCKYTYVIEDADKDHFLIQARNEDGHIEWEIRDNQTEPRKVPKEEAPEP